MKRCEACGVEVRGHTRCPLCQGALTGESERTPAQEHAYPAYKKQRRRAMLWRWLAVMIVTGCAVSVLINLANPGAYTRRVIGYIIGGGACALLEIGLLLSMRGSFARIICNQTLVISVLCVIWDWATGFYGWSGRYVIPFLLAAALLVIQIVRLSARQSFSDYGLRVLALSMVCNVFPLMVGVHWPGVVCAALGVFSALELCFLEAGKLRAELERRLHL